MCEKKLTTVEGYKCASELQRASYYSIACPQKNINSTILGLDRRFTRKKCLNFENFATFRLIGWLGFGE